MAVKSRSEACPHPSRVLPAKRSLPATAFWGLLIAECSGGLFNFFLHNPTSQSENVCRARHADGCSLSILFDHDHIFSVVEDHFPCYFVNCLSGSSQYVILACDILDFQVGINTLQQVVSFDNSHQMSIFLDNRNHASRLRSHLSDYCPYVVIGPDDGEILPHDLLDPGTHENRYRVILPNDQTSFDQLARHDGFGAEKPDEAVGDDAANHQGKKRIRIPAKLEKEHDGGKRRASNAAKNRAHGH